MKKVSLSIDKLCHELSKHEESIDCFWTVRNSMWFQINRKMVNKIWFQLIWQEPEDGFSVRSIVLVDKDTTAAFVQPVAAEILRLVFLFWLTWFIYFGFIVFNFSRRYYYQDRNLFCRITRNKRNNFCHTWHFFVIFEIMCVIYGKTIICN